MQRTILVIDDDIDLVEIIRVTLEHEGYSVLDAQTGDQGLELARREHPDLILLDVMMNDIDEGFQVAYRLRGGRKTADIPIVMLTAVADQTGFRFDPDHDAEFLPVDAYLEKPVAPQRLLEVVREHLPPRA